MRVKTPPIAAAFVLLVAVNVQAQASLDAARELYASAEYESALAMLDGLRASEWPREEQHAIELYRALCMVATRSRNLAINSRWALTSNSSGVM